MEITSKRLLKLRKSVSLPQSKMAAALGISQSALNRYEHDEATISDKVLLLYADYFDVSIDYICGRTENSEGKLFTARPNIAEDNEEMRQFIEMCFDPKSKMSVKLKDTIYQMMMGGEKNAE
jgi:transcriptional regulator with XRE-family HTH domain